MTITAEDKTTVDAPANELTVSAAVTPGPTGLTVPASQTLTITRMTETTPVVTLVSGSGVDLGERRREHGDREAEPRART